jgi:CxxC-x17-CxxC domain-containing protein
MESTYLPVLADKTLTCRDCGRTFPFTVREQEFYAEKGFNNQPCRCPECRAVNKARMAGGTAPVPTATFDRPDRQMYPAVCANCGKATQVPFEPRSGRPVYCRDCFVPRPASPGGSTDRGSSFGSGGPSASRGAYPRPTESRDRGGSSGSSSFGAAPAPERRATRRAKERRTDWEPSYESDGEFEDSYGRGPGKGRR